MVLATRTASSRSRSAKPARLPVCGYVFDEHECQVRGPHLCEPRAARAVAFFEEILVHTKDRWARRAFRLAPWQRDEIIRPLFGEVIWSAEFESYRRRYVIAWLELARKNGKSELLAGIALLLLIGDDVESAEVYGAAKDTKQARKVWDVAVRMVKLSPTLNRRLAINKQDKRIYDEPTGSYYEIVTADAVGELGHNPAGIVFDEILAQRNGDLWTALRTAMGARLQPLMVGATTAGNDPSSWCAQMHRDMETVAADPDRQPHVFVYMRNTPMDADPWDEANWRFANPALGDFLSIEKLREEALEARDSPKSENDFRQFRLNQWVRQVTRWMQLERWDATGNIQLVSEERLRRKACFGGLDIGRTDGIAAWMLDFPTDRVVEAAGNDDEPIRVAVHETLWRFFIPADSVADLLKATDGAAQRWIDEAFLRVTAGNVVDYEAVRAQIKQDARQFDIQQIGFNRRAAQQLAQQLTDRDGLELVDMTVGITLAPATQELERLVRSQAYVHGGNPVARWMIDGLAVKTDAEANVWPDKGRSGTPITGPVAAIMALDRATRAPARKKPGRLVSF